jgi:hypothetical protein
MCLLAPTTSPATRLSKRNDGRNKIEGDRLNYLVGMVEDWHRELEQLSHGEETLESYSRHLRERSQNLPKQSISFFYEKLVECVLFRNPHLYESESRMLTNRASA